eukprot:CAMPEP_0195619324 /NCGR_PEP_ID=MMETSP0815-20121206/14557_1 /TAXON_ID=97485 /ORGANISM="Prymnesium parvum, Strain Texoma1" /LENGTH=128 /DNA_ID=CAMNT_0040759923 /DNA_START=325 /DNA_END=711 /DNA_ORIENTATION=-
MAPPRARRSAPQLLISSSPRASRHLLVVWLHQAQLELRHRLEAGVRRGELLLVARAREPVDQRGDDGLRRLLAQPHRQQHVFTLELSCAARVLGEVGAVMEDLGAVAVHVRHELVEHGRLEILHSHRA